VVHGQIILNQFQHYPIKSVQRCAFISGLQERMRARRHSKLYLSKRKITAEACRGRKVNPMRNRSLAFKPVPMTATATTLVKSVWSDHFKGAAEEGWPLAGSLSACGQLIASLTQPWRVMVCQLLAICVFPVLASACCVRHGSMDWLVSRAALQRVVLHLAVRLL
jgi:hypothetical protein